MAVVGAGEVPSAIGMVAAGVPDLGQTVGAVAESGTSDHGGGTERGNRDARAGIEAVEQQDQRGYASWIQTPTTPPGPTAVPLASLDRSSPRSQGWPATEPSNEIDMW
jgi:hypothetical protein